MDLTLAPRCDQRVRPAAQAGDPPPLRHALLGAARLSGRHARRRRVGLRAWPRGALAAGVDPPPPRSRDPSSMPSSPRSLACLYGWLYDMTHDARQHAPIRERFSSAARRGDQRRRPCDVSARDSVLTSVCREGVLLCYRLRDDRRPCCTILCGRDMLAARWVTRVAVVYGTCFVTSVQAIHKGKNVRGGARTDTTDATGDSRIAFTATCVMCCQADERR